jgi:hypothetical protein
MALGGLRTEDLAGFQQQIAQTPLVITIAADLSKIDPVALESFGPLEQKKPAEVMRDIVMSPDRR